MKHLRLFSGSTSANGKEVDLPVVALVQGVENGLVMAPKTEEASEATISVSEGGEIIIKPKKEMFVDLGLPSGLKWARMNLNAEKETDYGHYYMWGSTTPNDNDVCDWDTCPWGSSTQPMTTLDAAHDAAQAAGIGRMPTKADFDELLANTTNEWHKDYQGSGVNGRLFTSKTNSNSIFIPASGYRNGSSFSNKGSGASVWSSSFYADEPTNAWYLFFNSGSSSMYGGGRCFGMSIRPVSE